MKGTKEKQSAEKAAMPLAALRDKNEGRGGSYTYDPVACVRERAENKALLPVAKSEVGNE